MQAPEQQAQEPPAEQSGGKGDAPRGEAAQADFALADDDPEKERETVLAEMLELGSQGEPFFARAIQVGFVAKDEVLVLDDPNVLRRQNAEAARPAAEGEPPAQARASEPDDAATKQEKRAKKKKRVPVRWVLIGPRASPFACANFKISSEGDTWVIGLSAPTAEHPAAEHGCILTLPPDRKDVRVTGP